MNFTASGVIFCECGHRKGIHWRGDGTCGWYESEGFSGKFENGKAVKVKQGQCPCGQFRLRGSK